MEQTSQNIYTPGGFSCGGPVSNLHAFFGAQKTRQNSVDLTEFCYPGNSITPTFSLPYGKSIITIRFYRRSKYWCNIVLLAAKSCTSTNLAMVNFNFFMKKSWALKILLIPTYTRYRTHLHHHGEHLAITPLSLPVGIVDILGCVITYITIKRLLLKIILTTMPLGAASLLRFSIVKEDNT